MMELYCKPPDAVIIAGLKRELEQKQREFDYLRRENEWLKKQTESNKDD